MAFQGLVITFGLIHLRVPLFRRRRLGRGCRWLGVRDLLPPGELVSDQLPGTEDAPDFRGSDDQVVGAAEGAAWVDLRGPRCGLVLRRGRGLCAARPGRDFGRCHGRLAWSSDRSRSAAAEGGGLCRSHRRNRGVLNDRMPRIHLLGHHIHRSCRRLELWPIDHRRRPAGHSGEPAGKSRTVALGTGTREAAVTRSIGMPRCTMVLLFTS